MGGSHSRLTGSQCSLKHVSGSKCHTNARVGLAHQISNLAGHPTVVNNDFQELRIAACIPRSSMLSVAALEGLFLMLACWRHVGPVSRVSTQRWRCLSCPMLIQKMVKGTAICFLVKPMWRCVTVAKRKSDITILAAETFLKFFLKIC